MYAWAGRETGRATCSLVPSSGIGISGVGDMKSTHVRALEKCAGSFATWNIKESTRPKYSCSSEYAAKNYLQEIQASYSLLW